MPSKFQEALAKVARLQEQAVRAALQNAQVPAPYNNTLRQTATGAQHQGGQQGNGAENLVGITPNLTASYRFIASDNDLIVKAEEIALADINVPKSDGLNAEITVRWEAETPLLIGENDNAGTSPLLIENQPVIPGSTLRGAIRSVAEIIGGGRLALSHVNHSETFTLRDFTHAAYANTAGGAGYPLGDPNEVSAGWLSITRTLDCTSKSGYCEIAEIEEVSNWYKFEVTQPQKEQSLISKYRNRTQTKIVQPDNETYNRLVRQYRDARSIENGRVRIIDTFSNPTSFALRPPTPDPQGYFQTVDAETAGAITGHFVFSHIGPDMNPPVTVRWEYVFEAHAPATIPKTTQIEPAIWQRFKENHSQNVNGDLRPQSSWKEFSVMLEVCPNLKIPVFYVGKLTDQNPETFAFGLTRLFKAPHKWGLGDVIKASGISDPMKDDIVDMGELDMIDALFGYVYEGPESKRDTTSPSALARRGRIAFSMARLVPASRTIPSEAISTVQGAPKPAFAPFYLAGATPDYSAVLAPKIAGRKRYPPNPNSDFNSIMQRLTSRADGQPPNNVGSQLHFLLPEDPATGIVFESKIRLTNVTKAELGLVISAITLGGGSTRRHAIGRAKNEGAGRIKAGIHELSVEYLSSAGPPEKTSQYDDFITAFDEHVGAQLSTPEKKAKFKAICDSFYLCCDQTKWIGTELVDLATKRGDGKFNGAGFKDLRKHTKLDKDGQNQLRNLKAHLSLLDARRKVT